MHDTDFLNLYEDASFYDWEFSTRDHDLDFYRRWASHAEGEVLEIACGTGRITLPLAQAGVAITGLDASEPMLAAARKKAQQQGVRVDWVHADCREFSLPKKFQRIFMAANALQHLLDLESLLAFLATARQHLSDDGLLLLDIFNPKVAKLSRKAHARYHFKDIVGPSGEERIRVEAASHYAVAEQILRFELFYLDPAGKLLRSKQVAMRCIFPQELELLCKQCGMTIADKFGNYDEQPFTSSAEKQIVVLRTR